LKQADLAEANGIEIGDAHDAIADCKLMISLLEKINKKKPELIDFFLSISSKAGVQEAVQQPGFLGLGRSSGEKFLGILLCLVVAKLQMI
jgi:exodeoxyribonuclease-1